jgi:hypothetical protein
LKTKTAYRKVGPAEISAPDIPEEPIQPSASTTINFDIEAEPAVAVVSADEYPAPDEATLALLKQLADLKKSEELQRQHANAQMAQRQQPMTRVEFLQSQGLTEAEAKFFDSREDMMANQQQASEAAAEALAAGIERDSPEFFSAVEEGFAKRVEALNRQPAAPRAAFIQPRSVSPAPSAAAPDRSSIYAAPVSRGTPSGGTGQRPARQVTLTPQEQEYARIAGVTDTEYARQKQRLALEKAAGERQQ